MPQYRVKAPDGRTFTINAPEGTTQQQALAYARSEFAKQKPKPKGGGPMDWISKNFLSPVNEAVIGAGEGVYNAANFVADPIARKLGGMIYGQEEADRRAREVDQQVKGVVDTARQNLVTQDAPIARDVGRIAGGTAVAAALPAERLRQGGMLARGAYRGLQGAVGGAAVRDVDESAVGPAASGAIANILLPPALHWLGGTRPVQALGGAVSRAMAPALRYFDEATGGTGAAAAPAAAPTAARPLVNLGREAEATAERFRRVGVEQPTTGMVTRRTVPSNFPQERKLARIAGAGDDLAQQIREVETSLGTTARSLVDRMGGSKGAEATGRSAQEALEAKSNEMQNITGRLYESVRETRGDEVIGNLNGLRGSFDSSEFADNPVFEDMTASIMKRLGRYADRDEGAVGITVRQAEELRKFIGKLGGASDPTARAARRELIDALDDDVVNQVGDDAFRAARASARARFEEFKGTATGKIAEEGIPVEKLSQRILSMPLDDLRNVRQSFLSGTPEQVARGTAAWRDMGAQSVDDLLKTSISDEGAVSGGKLLDNFRTRMAHLRVLLDPADYKDLRRLVYASRDATKAPPSSSAYGSDTAPEILNLLNAAPAATRKGWKALLGRIGISGLAAKTLGPVGPMAVEAGRAAAASAAQRRATEALAHRIEMASSPEAYAAARAALERAAQSNPAARTLLEQYGPAVGGTAAATVDAIAQ